VIDFFLGIQPFLERLAMEQSDKTPFSKKGNGVFLFGNGEKIINLNQETLEKRSLLLNLYVRLKFQSSTYSIYSCG
jgi:hypothetical protein